MTCADRAEQLLLLAAGALDEVATQGLRAHLDSGCPRCAGAWTEAQATLALLTLELPPVSPSPEVRDRLMERVAADAAGPAEAPVRPARGALGTWLRPALAAGIAATVTYLAFAVPLNRRQSATEAVVARQDREIGSLRESVDASRELTLRQAELQQTLELQRTEIARLEREVSDALRQLDEQPAQDQRMAAYRRQIADNESEIARLKRGMTDARQLAQTLGSPEVDVVTLAGSGPGKDATGRIFWDRKARVWHFYATGLPDAAPGRTYALWFITSSDRKVEAGLFDVDESGNGSLTVSVPRSIGAIALAAVTDEPLGGMPQPTGAIHLAGQVPAARVDS